MAQSVAPRFWRCLKSTFTARFLRRSAGTRCITRFSKPCPGFLDGKATMREIRIFFTEKDTPFMDMLLVLPNSASEKPVPTFLGLNFEGNHSVNPSKEITITKSWIRERDHVATEEDRGVNASRWLLNKIIGSWLWRGDDLLRRHRSGY